MDAKAKTVRDILYAGDQYLIPFFQRHYSWKLKNWQRLWDDLRALVEDPKPRLHFMGPLVCTPVNHMPGEVPVYQLIDGQQRLTTLTVLLSVLRDLAAEHKLQELADDVSEKYLFHKREKGLSRYKVVPRVGDREVLFAVIDGKSADQSRRDGIIRAHRFFKAAVGEYVRGDEDKRLRQLVTGVTGRLSLVVITVEGENPYEIFESLNSTGLPLEEADLIRNFIFMKVPLGEQEEFHKNHWQPFESLFEETDDHNAIDPTAFYRDYLMRDGTYSRKNSTFADFKDHLKARDIDAFALLDELRRYAKFELMLRRSGDTPDTRLDAALTRIDQLDVATSYPLLIHLLARQAEDRLSIEELLECIADVESFVIRRSVCGESTKGYSEMFPAAIKAIQTSPRDDLRRYWAARGWPDDATLISRLLDFALYRRDAGKCLLILQSLERSYGHKEGPDLDELTIEHVLPQSIAEGKYGREWQAMLGDDWEAQHEAWLHTLGNLTLTGYNPKLSNRPFAKKQQLFEDSNVQLNKYFAELTEWDAKAIKTRGKKLAGQVAALWPRPVTDPYRPGKPDPIVVYEGDKTEQKALRAEYWQEFLKVLAASAPSLQPSKGPGEKCYVRFPTDRSGCGFAVALDFDEACVNVELFFRGSGAWSDLLVIRQDEEAIEAELGQQVDWHEEEWPARAALYLDSTQPANRDDWARQHRWLAENLQNFVTVMSPRVYTEFDSPAAVKKLQLEFWTALNLYLMQADSPLKMPSPKERTSREIPFGRGVSLRFEICPEHNWVWLGLVFEGDDADGLNAIALKHTEALTEPPVKAAIPEESTDYKWLGPYRLAFLQDRKHWPEYIQWMHKVAEKLKHVYDAHLATAELAEAATA